ncbi:hypothetical protein KDK95_33815 [Actinospica sp. MGRD01-02]|uniref:DUF4190 domain-containing protein n=1 Tax=Actinospica acidithermotolerans TaxID=2828514 RepID=A0A941EH41_9ACTN|nr:hypothetical protein [Actinospica acidithermotolerans]MBR7831331.1 hypothetical protein [Actinospica acidithermotolerans]
MAEQTENSGAGTRLADRPVQSGPAAGSSATATAKSSATALPGSRGARGQAGATGATPTTSKPIPFAAVSFVCGLVGLLVANLVLGPLAIVLGVIGVRSDRSRRFRAVLGILLGAADIAVFLLLAAHSAHSGTHGSLSWNFFSN